MPNKVEKRPIIRKAQPAPMQSTADSGCPTVLYKYASLDKPQYFFDTIVNQHLYAGLFSEMNDPMEGTYRSSEQLNQKVKDYLWDKKTEMRFCALAPSPYRTLMWSYYAKEHKGYCLEINVERVVPDSLVKMIYDNNIPTDIAPDDESIKRLLCRKFTDWAHEEEWRLFAPYGCKYIENIIIKKIYFGSKMNKDDYNLYKGILEKIAPNIKVEKMKRSLLLEPENHIDTSNKLNPKKSL